MDKQAGVAQLVEHQPSKLRVAGSSLVARSVVSGQCSSGVEHFHGKEGVGGSNPFIGSDIQFLYFLNDQNFITDGKGNF